MKYSINKILSNGYVFGNAKVIKNDIVETDYISISSERNAFLNAIEKSLEEINGIKSNKEEINNLLLVQRYMITDPMFKDNVLKLIDEGLSAKDSIYKVLNEIKENLNKSDSSYLNERAIDIEDVAHRVINNLIIKDEKKDYRKYIIVVDKLMPSSLLKFQKNTLGVISKFGGYTSHSAILCRLWNIPYVISDIDIKDGDKCIIDTRKNHIIINPDIKEIEEYIEETSKIKNNYIKNIDHNGYLFLANIASTLDINRVLEYNFDGVGLFRTEMIFMNSNRPYTYLEQYEIYMKAAELLKDKQLCFRTFDIADDKYIPYLNPANKGLDNYLKNIDIFKTQVKAMLASNIYGNVKIMFPMIKTIDEFKILKNIVIEIAKENNYVIPPLGITLETKKAIDDIYTFSELDFISIGTNDLTKELYGVNRDDNIDEDSAFIKDLFDRLKKVVEFCNINNIMLSVCGELASIKKIALGFYKIGIKNLSVAPSSIKMLATTYQEFISEED